MRHFALLAVLCLAFVTTGSLNAAIETPAFDRPWEAFAIEPAALLAMANAVEPEEDAAIQRLLLDVSLTFDAEGRLERRTTELIRVLDAVAVEGASRLEEVWRPWHQERPILRARVISPEGQEAALESATIAEVPVYESNPNILTDLRRLRAPLPTVTPGALIEVETVLRDQEPFFSAGAVHAVGVRQWQPTHRVRVVVEAPGSLPLRWNADLIEVEPREETLGDRRRWTFDLGPQPAEELPESDLPPDVAAYAVLEFSTGESWPAVAAAYSAVVDRQIAGNGLAAAVQVATAGIDGRRERIAALLAWVQSKVRYTGLEFGEAALVPNPTALTLERGFGDCKDKAALLVSLLRQAGIPAHIALLRTGPDREVARDLPGLAQFDHAIVYLPGEPAIWIDPTVEAARAGQLPWADQNRWALIASLDTRELIRTPEPVAEANLALARRRFEIVELAHGTISEVSLSHGVGEIEMRTLFSRLTSEQASGVLNHLATDTHGGTSARSHSYTEPRSLAEPWSYSIEVAEAASVVSELAQAAVFLDFSAMWRPLPNSIRNPPACEPDDERFAAPEPELERVPAEARNGEQTTALDEACIGDFQRRKHPLMFRVPFVSEVHGEIVAPPGFELREVPEPIELAQGTMRFSFQATEQGPDRLTFLARFDSGKIRLEAAEVEGARELLRTLGKLPVTGIWFDHRAEVLAESGDITGALRELRQLEAAHPTALNAVRKAYTLLAAGLGYAARREAQRAVELDPTSSLAHQAVGFCFEVDEIGREFSRGPDRETAIVAFRKALELEPDGPDHQRDLGLALEVGEDGIRYSSSARLGAAIDHYRAALETNQDATLRSNLAIDLLRTHRYQEALALAIDAESGDSLVNIELAALAADQGAPAALSKARRLTSGAPRTEALVEAASLLVSLRLYPVAAELLASVARSDSGSAELASRATLLQQIRRLDEVTANPADPGSIVALLLRKYILGDDDIPELFIDDETEARTKESLVGAKILLQSADVGLSVESFVDYMFSWTETTVEGDPRYGHRVTMSFAIGGVGISFFTMPFEGRHAILANEDDLSPLGERALDLLGQGDEEGARQLLRWAREEAPVDSADDPFSGSALSLLWPAAPADAELAPERVRLAAAALAAGGSAPAKPVEILEAGLEAATGSERRGILSGLVVGYLKLERFDNAVRLARLHVAEAPNSETAHNTLFQALRASGQPEAIIAAAEHHLSLVPDNEETVLAMATAHGALGELAKARDLLQRLAKTGKAKAEIHNQLAWYGLLEGDSSAETLEQAERAVQLTSQADYASLYTLATAYAEAGRLSEARRTVLEALMVALRRELEDADWYIFGRIAEELEEIEDARAAYEKVAAPEEPMDLLVTTYALAQRRLAGLRAPDQAAAPARDGASPAGPVLRR